MKPGTKSDPTISGCPADSRLYYVRKAKFIRVKEEENATGKTTKRDGHKPRLGCADLQT